MRFRRFQRSYHVQGQAFTATLFSGPDARRDRCERELLNAEVPLRLTDRAVWAGFNGVHAPLFVGITDQEQNCLCGFGLQVERCRSLPGHFRLIAERFGPALDSAARHAGLMSLVDIARTHSRVVQVRVEAFSRDERVRKEIAESAKALGFRPAPSPRSYPYSIAIDLSPSEAEIFASLHGTARRHIRAVQKNPVSVKSVDDISLGPRIEELMREALDRTGGRYEKRDWARLIELSAAHSDLSRVVGLFRTDSDGPQRLLACAMGFAHGDHVQYGYAAATRRTDLRMPLSYALAWDLICWGKQTGAAWFDFGGVTAGSHSDEGDPLGGISDFKRYFSRNIERVGDEWILEPRVARAAAANSVSRIAGLLRRVPIRLRRNAGAQ